MFANKSFHSFIHSFIQQNKMGANVQYVAVLTVFWFCNEGFSVVHQQETMSSLQERASVACSWCRVFPRDSTNLALSIYCTYSTCVHKTNSQTLQPCCLLLQWLFGCFCAYSSLSTCKINMKTFNWIVQSVFPALKYTRWEMLFVIKAHVRLQRWLV